MDSTSVEFILNLSDEVENIRKFEKNKLPYNINIIDELHINENANTRILLKLLQYKDKGEYPFLLSFLKMMDSNFPIWKIKEPSIKFNKEDIDGLIEEIGADYGVIIENKIYDAVDQNKQIERYINSVKRHGITEKEIYVIYLTKNGNKKICSYSLTDEAKKALNYDKKGQCRFIEMNYKNHILPWLINDVLPEIKVKDDLLYSAVKQYIDYLEGLLHIRKIERPMINIMRKEISKQLGIDKFTSLSTKWNILDVNHDNVGNLLLEIDNMKRELEKSVIDKWCKISEEKWEEYNNQLYRGYFQLFLNKITKNVHFEWLFNVNDLFKSSRYKFSLHSEGADNKFLNRFERNDAFLNKAKDLDFNIFLKDTTVIYKYIDTPNNKPFAELDYASQLNFLNGLYDDISGLKSIIESTYSIFDSECSLTSQLRDYMQTKTNSKWGVWPESKDKNNNEQAWDLVKKFNENTQCIGIESSLGIDSDMKPEYRIFITVWKKENWTKEYNDKLRVAFPEAFEYKFDDKRNDNRIFLHIPPIKLGLNIDSWKGTIIPKLKYVYEKMLKVVE